ncbi:MAG TPA: DUF2231 domain-containing protein [Gaiellaceae bacterium]|nr:DUF2231 domain-containing protein [Gaiellaceae bacterium]
MAEFKPSYLIRGLPGHPLHPPLTDVTIGAYTFAAIAAVLSKFGLAEHGLAQAWWLAVVVALCSTVLTALTGLLDWLTITWGSELWKTATAHALVNLSAGVLFLLAAIFGHGGYVEHRVTTGAFVLTLVGFATLLVGGWLGGAITYVHGMRVLSLVDEPALKAAAPVASKEKVEAAEG